MKNSEQQLTIETDAVPTTHSKVYKRTCEQCKKEYDAVLKTSRFCGGVCRAKANRDNKKLNGTTEPVEAKAPTPAPEKNERVPKPIFDNISPQLSIAINLLQKEIDRNEKLYNEERKRRKDLEQQVQNLKDQMRDKEHQAELNGIEAAKPDLMDRVLSGLSQLPPSIVDQFAPIIGRLGNMMVPPTASMPLEGEANAQQLDEMSLQLLQWISTLTEENKDHLFKVIGSMMNMDQAQQTSTLDKIINLLSHGSTIAKNQSGVNGIDQTMYG